jgi:integrase
MKTVQPIRDAKIISQLKKLLQERGSKYYIMFIIGLNTGLRVSDILNLKSSDIRDKSHVNITEQKTGKYKRFLINNHLKKEIYGYISGACLRDDDYVIPSRKGKNQPITRIQAYRVLNDAARELNLDEIGTHTMRKTFGYWFYQRQEKKDLAVLQYIFNHSSPSITLRYIGINDDMIDKAMEEFDYD